MGKPVALEARAELRETRGIHFDDIQLAVFGIDGKLDIRTAGFNADGPDDLQRRIAHDLVFFIGQRLGRGDGDAVAGVNAHRVEIFNRADDDDVVLAVAHHFQLVFLPADDGFFDQNLMLGAEVQPPLRHTFIFFDVIGNIAAHAAQRIGRPDNRRKADFLDDFHGLFERLGIAALREPQDRYPE